MYALILNHSQLYTYLNNPYSSNFFTPTFYLMHFLKLLYIVKQKINVIKHNTVPKWPITASTRLIEALYLLVTIYGMGHKKFPFKNEILRSVSVSVVQISVFFNF